MTAKPTGYAAAINSPRELFEVLARREGGHQRMVYEAQDGSYWVDYGGGRVPGSVLGAALTMNRLRPAFPDCIECKAWRLIA